MGIMEWSLDMNYEDTKFIRDFAKWYVTQDTKLFFGACWMSNENRKLIESVSADSFKMALASHWYFFFGRIVIFWNKSISLTVL